MRTDKQPSLKEVISLHVLQKLVDLSTSESDTASVRAAEKLITLLEKNLLPNVKVSTINGLQVDLDAFNDTFTPLLQTYQLSKQYSQRHLLNDKDNNNNESF
ncbi:hypothetical protein ACPV5G_00810 [Photobacterium damselae]|uniref:hypothetical protein n=1 Tax=Photobacterium damselae TaxID=38293 RepID=UPI0040685A90